MNGSTMMGTTMRKTVPMLLVALLVLAGGCFKVKDQLTINADGSGAVEMQVRYAGGAGLDQMIQMIQMNPMGRGKPQLIYPPFNEEQARSMFKGEGIETTVNQESDDKGITTLTVSARFADINQLLQSEYAEAHALQLTEQDGVVRLRAMSGVQRQVSMMQNEERMSQQQIKAMEAAMDPAFRSDKTSLEFSVTLPVAAGQNNGKAEGNTVTWLLDRATMKDNAEAAEAFARRLDAQWAAEGIAFVPVSPLRLELMTFGELVEGPTGPAPRPRDAAAIAQAVQFVPLRLTVQRTMDLTGEGYYGNNQAQLTGMVVLPREMAPDAWAATKLSEVVDDKGQSLMLSADRRFNFFGGGMTEEGTADGDKVRQVVQLTFRSPDRTVKKIRSLKAEAGMQYYGQTQLLKLENVIPADAVVDMSGPNARFQGQNDRKLSSPALGKYGIDLSLGHAMKQRNQSTVMLEMKSSKISPTEVAVYDAEGKAVQAFAQIMRQSDGDFAIHLMVMGEAKLPWSLVLLGAEINQAVSVPMELKDVDLTQTSTPAASPADSDDQ